MLASMTKFLMTSSGIRAWDSLTTSCKSGDNPAGVGEFCAWQTPAVQKIQPMAAEATAAFKVETWLFINISFNAGEAVIHKRLHQSILFLEGNLAGNRRKITICADGLPWLDFKTRCGAVPGDTLDAVAPGGDGLARFEFADTPWPARVVHQRRGPSLPWRAGWQTGRLCWFSWKKRPVCLLNARDSVPLDAVPLVSACIHLLFACGRSRVVCWFRTAFLLPRREWPGRS